MSKYIIGKTNHTILVDPNNSYSAFSTGNPMPVETVAGSTSKTIGSDSTINVLGGTVTAPSTHTSNSERSYEPDVGVFFKADQAGTLKFQFSPDDVNWSTFPVNGFTIAAGIWEFHTAVKLPRYFRWTYTPTSGTATFDAYVYYGTYRQGNAPLNQSIGGDSDAVVVRSVQVGVEPDNITYSNVKKDGTAFRTVSNLAGTTLDADIVSDVYVGNITVGSTASFAPSGFVLIDSEFLQYDSVVDRTTLNVLARGSFGSTAAAHTAGVAVGGVYWSGVLTLLGYTQVATKTTCSNNCQYRFRWFYDSGATDPVRTITPSYTAANGYDFLSAPNFGPYVEYVLGNKGTTDTTDLYFETDFYTKSVSAQILGLNSNIVGGMTANLGRNVIVAQTEAGSYINVGTTDDGELFTNSKASNRQTRGVYSSGSITGDTYAILIDLSAEIYNNYANIDNIGITCNFSTNNSFCSIKVGVITRIDGTNADISYLLSIPFSAANANTFLSYINNYSPSSIRFQVSGGAIQNAFTNDTGTGIAAVNTGITLSSPRGSVTPAVGDIIALFDHTGNNFSSTINYIYHTD